MHPRRPTLTVDLDALRHNLDLLRRAVAPADVMVVVKADAYGHGLVRCAETARAAGITWLGVATVAEALALRSAGDTGRIVCWLDAPGPEPDVAVGADLDLTAYTVEEVAAVADAAARLGTTARLQLKVDTGLSRGGASPEDWAGVVARADEAQRAGQVRVTGVWSHFACSDDPDHPANDAQEAAFREALAVAQRLDPETRHLANSAAALLRPSSRFDLVRCGIAAYGLDPAPGVTPPLGLRPVMTATAPLTLVKRIAAGAGVSYGHTWTAPQTTTVGLVPVGYGDGVPRQVSNRAEVLVAGRRRPVRGRVCMDQLVVDLGDDHPEQGETVVLFGPGGEGEPTAQDWAVAADTITYEIVTRLGGRFERRWVGGGAAE
jgi:alanine racemase